jgi:hypothetical protein
MGLTMSRTRAVRSVQIAITILVLAVSIAISVGDELRMHLLVGLVWATLPSSTVSVPLANLLCSALQLETTRSIDLVLSVTMLVFGSLQWLVVGRVVSAALRRRRRAPAVSLQSRIARQG